jgi:hypothetical protein
LINNLLPTLWGILLPTTSEKLKMNNLLGELAAWYVLGNNHSKPTAEEVL